MTEYLELAPLQNNQLEADPLRPFFRLIDASVRRESVLDTLCIAESKLSGGCKDEQMVQLGVDGSDVETMVGRVKLKDPFEQTHGKL